jgi:hypothetical protein
MPTKRILRLTNTEALVKVDGTVGSVTIDLQTDLKLATEELVGNQQVNIVLMQVAGKTNSVLSVARNGVNLWDLQAGSALCVNLLDIGGASDSTENTSDIVVTSSGAEGQLILKLRKVSGYKTLIRTEQNGSQDPVTP